MKPAQVLRTRAHSGLPAAHYPFGMSSSGNTAALRKALPPRPVTEESLQTCKMTVAIWLLRPWPARGRPFQKP
jgi:hypothetical protein